MVYPCLDHSCGYLFFWYYNDNKHDADDDLMTNDSITQIDNDQIYRETNEDTTSLYDGSYGDVVNEKAIADYLTYIDNEKMGVDHQFTNGALMHLITATEAEARNMNVDVNANLEQAKQQATEITKDPTSLKHADKIKIAAGEISTALKTIQEQKFPNLSSEADMVKTLASKIDTKMATLQQKEDVKSFFDNSGKLLQNMNAHENDNQ